MMAGKQETGVLKTGDVMLVKASPDELSDLPMACRKLGHTARLTRSKKNSTLRDARRNSARLALHGIRILAKLFRDSLSGQLTTRRSLGRHTT